jgi:hypothetical protein
MTHTARLLRLLRSGGAPPAAPLARGQYWAWPPGCRGFLRGTVVAGRGRRSRVPAAPDHHSTRRTPCVCVCDGARACVRVRVRVRERVRWCVCSGACACACARYQRLLAGRATPPVGRSSCRPWRGWSSTSPNRCLSARQPSPPSLSSRPWSYAPWPMDRRRSTTSVSPQPTWTVVRTRRTGPSPRAGSSSSSTHSCLRPQVRPPAPFDMATGDAGGDGAVRCWLVVKVNSCLCGSWR